MVKDNSIKLSSNREEKVNYKCIACREIIQSGAIICPHCGKTQKKAAWNQIGTVLKWIGGITAVISLLSTAINFFQLMERQNDRDLAVERHLRAAERFLIDNYPLHALTQIEEALKINPNHTGALEKQTEYVMQSLRSLSVRSSGDYIRKMALKYRPILESMIGNENNKKASDAMAHLAWCYHFIWDREYLPLIGPLLSRSIKMDKYNVYANVFWANLCLGQNTIAMNIECGEDTLKTAKYYWEKADKSGREKEFVFESKVDLLSVSNGTETTLFFFEFLATEVVESYPKKYDDYRGKALVQLWNTALDNPDELIKLGARIGFKRFNNLVDWARVSEEPIESVNNSVKSWHLARRNALDKIITELKENR